MARSPDDHHDGDIEHAWDQAPKAGWDAFRAARDVFLLGRAVDTALHGVERDAVPPDDLMGSDAL